MFSSLMSSIVASNLGVRSVVMAGKEGDAEIAAHLKKIRSRLLTNTTVVLLRPGMESTADGKWLLERNPLYRATLQSLDSRKGKSLVQVCEGTKCLDTFDMSGLDRALEDLN